MRKLIAWVFMHSLDGLLAGTEYWQFCFGLPVDRADLKQKIGVYQSAYAHIMGRAAYEGIAGPLPTADHPFTGIMNAAGALPTRACWRNVPVPDSGVCGLANASAVFRIVVGSEGALRIAVSPALSPR
ncbi:MAG: hypothetical protein JJD93_16770 [Ilumatobacteraceae bacterium]|nr:hypothetical protein [Ilumatobacteraceae bacterium]